MNVSKAKKMGITARKNQGNRENRGKNVPNNKWKDDEITPNNW